MLSGLFRSLGELFIEMPLGERWRDCPEQWPGLQSPLNFFHFHFVRGVGDLNQIEGKFSENPNTVGAAFHLQIAIEKPLE